MLSVLLPVNNTPTDDLYVASHGDLYTPPPIDDHNSLFDIILDQDLSEEAEDYAPLGDNQLTFQVGEEIENITEVTIDSCIYTLGYEPLAPGEFIFDPVTGTVIVELKQEIHETTNVDYKVPPPVPPILSNVICDRTIVPLFERWNIKQADITINYTFGSEPTLSDFSFVACKSEANYINSALCNGTEFAAFNNRWVINKLTIVLLKNSDQIGVSISSVHHLASRGNPSKSYLDERIKVKNSTSALISSRKKREAEYNETTTRRQELTEEAQRNKQFIYYGRDKAEARPWAGTRIHTISECEVKGDIALVYNGHGSIEDGIKLHTEYRNLKVNLDFDPDQSDRKIGVTKRWSFENCQSLSHLVRPIEYRGWAFYEPEDKLFRNTGINFDAGGEIKKATQIVEFNGTPTSERHLEYGWAFSSDEAYSVQITSQNNIQLKFKTIQTPNNYHKRVKFVNKVHYFDNYGYKIQTSEKGSQIARLQQESEKLEAILYRGQAIRDSTELDGIIIPDPSKTNQANAYRFKETLPIAASTVYDLSYFSDYFEDTVSPEEKCDDDYVPPKFVHNKYYRLKTEIIKANPKNNQFFIFPAVISGKYTEKTTRTFITNRHFPYKHEVRNFHSNAEGEYGKNAIYNSSATQNIGKPGLAPRLDREINRSPISKNSAYEKYKNSNYYISSPGVTGIEANEGSKGFPEVDTPGKVLELAKVELSITNTQNSLTTTIDIHYRDDLEVGDRVTFHGKMWVIFGISDQRTIGGCQQLSKNLSVTMGRLLKPDLVMGNRLTCGGGGLNPVTVTPPEPIPVLIPDHFYPFEGNTEDANGGN